MRAVAAQLVIPAMALLASALGGCAGPGAPPPPPPAFVDPREEGLSRRELLGKRLFEDATLSEPGGQACASCHRYDQAYTGTAGSPVEAVAQGSRAGMLGTRNVPSILYASFSPPFAFRGGEPSGGQFRDGRAADLATQALGPLLNPREMNASGPAQVVEKVRRGPYALLFAEVFGEAVLDDVDLAFTAIGQAIAAYESTGRFHPFASRFDRVLRGEAQLDAREARGLELFLDPAKGNCLACHAGLAGSHDPADWLLTDFTYDTLGIPRNRTIPDDGDPAFFDLGLCDQPGLAERAPPGFDLASTCGAFKVPSLRDVARTAPYMHNGAFVTLQEVVRFYVTRDSHPERWYPVEPSGAVQVFDDLPARYHGNVNTSEVPYLPGPGQSPRLTDDEIDAVVAFLESLSDPAPAAGP